MNTTDRLLYRNINRSKNNDKKIDSLIQGIYFFSQPPANSGNLKQIGINKSGRIPLCFINPDFKSKINDTTL